jgi:hypothetical protein
MFGADDLAEGQEQFARAVAEHHAREGFKPILVGIRTGLGAHQTANGGPADMHVGGAVADIRRFLLEKEISLVHAISHASVGAARAVRFTNMILICGLRPDDAVRSGPSPPLMGTDHPVQDILSVFERADAVYANSPSLQKAIEEEFGVRCPVVSELLPS